MSANTYRNWLSESELLYSRSLTEYQDLEGQLEQLEQQLATKKVELNQIGQALSKPLIESNRRISAQLVDGPPSATVVSPVTRVLNGRGLGRG